jgi:hypothetical protein
MSADDKNTLDDLVNTPGGVNSVSAGGGIDVAGTSAVTVSHENTSSAASINNGPAEHIDALTVDTYGHVTAVSKQTMSASDIGAASTGELTTHKSSGDHDSRYYTEAEVDARLNVKLNTTNPDATGEYRIGGSRVLDKPSTILRGWVGATQAFGIGGSICELGGVAFEPGTFTVEAHETGALRELVYTTKASSERFKQDIAPSTLNGGECLKWNAERFRYIKDVEANGDRAATREWYIAERIFDASGERFIIRDREGRIQNTDDRAMIADMVLTIQQLEDRITKLEAKLS